MKKLLYILVTFSLFTAGANLKGGEWEIISQNPKIEQYKHTLSFVSTDFFDDNIGFACTADGKIYTTQTRAQDWELLYSNDNFVFTKIAFREDFLGFVIGIDKTKPKGSNGILLISDDSGYSWRQLETPGNIEFTAIHIDGTSVNVLFADVSGSIYLINVTTLLVENRLEFVKVYESNYDMQTTITSIVKTEDTYFAMVNIPPSETDKFILAGDRTAKEWKEIKLNVEFKSATANEEIAYAISTDGKAIYSITNKECKVAKLYQNDMAKLNEITIQRKDFVVACGDGGQILYSKDEGKSWNFAQQKFAKDFKLISSGNDRSFIMADALVLTKDRNREEWFDPTTPVDNPNYSQLYKDTLKCVYFLNDDVGFFVGNREKKLFRTFDGCKTFDTLSFKDVGWYVRQRFNTISFNDDKEGVILNDFAEAIHTKDGGKTWEKKHFSGPKIRQVNASLFRRPYIYCAESNGRSYRSDFENVYYDMYLIGDFGEGVDMLSIDCYDNVPVAVGKNRSYVRDQNKNIELPSVKGINYSYPEHFTSIKMGKDAGFIVSNYGVIYRTTDNGLNWGVVTKFNNPLYSLHYNPQKPNEIYAVGDGIIVSSNDNGKSWKEEITNFKLDEIKLRSVFVTDNTVYAVGVNNAILRKKFSSSVVEADTTENEVFPNPAENEITIPSAGNKEVKIVDISGKTVLETKATNGKVKIDTLPQGMYNAVVDGKSYKFMKQ